MIFNLVEKFKVKKYIEYYPIEIEFLNIKNVQYEYKLDIDRVYYNMLESSLNHILYCFCKGLKNSRQIVYTSNDCISFIQIIFLDKNSLECFVCQRSLDVIKHGSNDIYFIFDWLLKKFKDYENIKVRYNILVPHKYEV